MKQVIIAIVAIVAIIGGATLLGGNNNDQVEGTQSNHFYGLETAPVTVIEYADFECPACAAYFPIVQQVKEQYKDQIRFEFRHYPLVQIHGNAQAAHRAAEAAGKQGKFWEMHDLLYEQQNLWNSQATDSPTATFESYAQQLNLDMEQFKTDVAASETLATINADIAQGKEDGVSGTPTFFINGQKIEDATTIDSVAEFSAVIDEALGITNTTDSEEATPSESNTGETAPEATETSGE